MSEHTDVPLLRVEKGTLDPLELAAVTVVLLHRLNAARREPEPGSWPSAVSAPWRRPERIPAYRGPRSWQAQAA
ncbi:acyl-CoA carboxylase subunit epsilon [Thermomonospora echinospora]|nr:acyl-CoA carboxylase subunit epsilon [Thermomonospora echinospora]